MITKRQKYIMYFYIIRALFLGVGVSLIINIGKRDSWIGAIIGLFIGVLMAMLIKYVQKNKNDKNIFDVLKEMKWFGWIVKFLFISLALFIIVQSIVTLNALANNFFLRTTPSWLLSLTIIVLILYIVSKGLKSTFRMGEILFPISFVILVSSFIFEFHDIDLNNIIPVFTEGSFSIFKSSFYFASLSCVPLLLTLQVEDDGKCLVPVYIISALSLIVIIFFCISIFGPSLASIYEFPEYIILKKVSVFNFIEKIENVLSIVWIIDIIGLIVFCSHFLKASLPKKNNKTWFYEIYLIIYVICAFAFGNLGWFDIKFFNYSPYILGILFLLIIIPLLIHVKKIRKHYILKC